MSKITLKQALLELPILENNPSFDEVCDNVEYTFEKMGLKWDINNEGNKLLIRMLCEQHNVTK